MLDYAATKAKKKEILDRGGKIYNKVEEEWCKARGLDYEYEDHKVFKKDEYYYEICLLYPHIKNMYDLEITASDYRGSNLRGKTNNDLLDETDRDKEAIMKLNLDVKTKLTLCDQADNLLYTNFIRNENQESYRTWAFGRKDR